MIGRFLFLKPTTPTWSAALLLVLLTGCGDKVEKQTLAQAAPLIEARQYANALGTLNEGLRQSPQSRLLLRERIVVFLRLERADLAFAAQDDMIKRLGKEDAILLDSLAHPDPVVRATAAKALSAAKDPKALQPLQNATKDPEEIVRRAAVNALGRMADAASVPALITSLADGSWFVRSEAATALGGLGEIEAIEPLLKTVTDSDPFVKFAASNAVVALAQPAAGRVFLSHLHDTDSFVQATVALALAKIKDPAGVSVLLREVRSSKDVRLRRRCLESLANLGDPQALTAIQSAVGDRDPTVQFAAVTALASIPHPSSVPIVQRAANDAKLPPPLRERAREVAVILGKKLEKKP